MLADIGDMTAVRITKRRSETLLSTRANDDKFMIHFRVVTGIRRATANLMDDQPIVNLIPQAFLLIAHEQIVLADSPTQPPGTTTA